MSRRKRVVRTVEDLSVPPHVLATTAAIWLLLGTALWLHLDTLELPQNYPLLLAWATGGFASALFYILFACE